MRKLLVVLMVVAFAATAFAVDVKLSGDFEVKGIYLENRDFSKNKSKSDYGTENWWEQDGAITAKIGVAKGTSFTVRGDFRDGTWGTKEMQAKKPGKMDNQAGTDESGFTVQRAFLEHDFGKVQLAAGLMSTGGWGTAFRNNVEGNYRIKLMVPVADGILTFQTTKAYEGSNNESYHYRNSGKDDSTQYGVDFIGKLDAFTYGVNVIYKNDSRVNDKNKPYGEWKPVDPSDITTATKGDSDAIDQFDLSFLLKGDFGQFGFESEFAYVNTNTDVKGEKDWNAFGAYINGFGTFDKATVGLAFVYTSVDKKTGKTLDYGDDFDVTFIVDEIEPFSGNRYDDLAGFTTFKPYVDFAVTEDLTVGAAFAYAFSNFKKSTVRDGKAIDLVTNKTRLYEFDAYVSYQINRALNYTVKAAYLQADKLSADNGATKYNADPIYYASHTLSLAF